MELPHPRFFATALVDEYYRVWHVWVTAVCDKDTAWAYLADIRLGPNIQRLQVRSVLSKVVQFYAINIVSLKSTCFSGLGMRQLQRRSCRLWRPQLC